MENRKERLQATPISTFACLSVWESQTDSVSGVVGASEPLQHCWQKGREEEEVLWRKGILGCSWLMLKRLQRRIGISSLSHDKLSCHYGLVFCKFYLRMFRACWIWNTMKHWSGSASQKHEMQMVPLCHQENITNGCKGLQACPTSCLVMHLEGRKIAKHFLWGKRKCLHSGSEQVCITICF